MRTFYGAFLTCRMPEDSQIYPSTANSARSRLIFAGRNDVLLTIPSILLANRGPGFGNSVFAFYFCSVTDFA